MTQQNDLANYLQLMLKAGKSKAQITSALKAACWPDDIIEEQFAKLPLPTKDLWKQPSWPISQHTWNSPANNSHIITKNTVKIKQINDKKPTSVIRQAQLLTKTTTANNKVTVINLLKPEKSHQVELVKQKSPILAETKKTISQQQVIPIINHQSIDNPLEKQPITNHPQDKFSKPLLVMNNSEVKAETKNPNSINNDHSKQDNTINYFPLDNVPIAAVNLPTIEQLTKPFIIEERINTDNASQSLIRQAPDNKIVETNKTNSSALMEKIISRHQVAKQPLPKSIRHAQQKAKDFDKQQFKGIVFGLFLCLIVLLALSWQLLVR